MITRAVRLARAEWSRTITQRLFLGIAGAAIAGVIATFLFLRLESVESYDVPRTAFACFGDVLRGSSWILALGVFLLGCLSMSQETSGRTVQNTLLLPVSRTDVLLGKAAALAWITTALFVATSLLGLALSSWAYDFTDASADGYVLVERSTMVRHTLAGWALSLAPLIGWAILGLALSTLFRSLAASLAAGGFVFALLAASQFFAADAPVHGLLFVHYTDRFFEVVAGLAGGLSDAFWERREIVLGLGTSLLSAIVLLLLSLLSFRRAELGS